MNPKSVICSLLLLSMLTGCQSQPVKPFTRGDEIRSISSDENRVWLQSREFDKTIRNQGSIYNDPEATAYLQTVMDRLYPEFKGKITVKIVKTPILNAFALPNGSIYMHLGMLARIDNEAQLAAILAHEGAHFILKHGYLQSENVKSSRAFALVVGIAGVPLVGDIIAISSIYGFSQDQETEADTVGFQRMLKAGYDTKEASKIFAHLLKELKALDIDEPYFFSSHPKLQERIDSYNVLHEKYKHSGGGIVNEEKYLEMTGSLRLDSLKADLSMDRYKSMILVLEDEHAGQRFGEHRFYYLGEAYRRRGEKGDYDKAARAYKKAIDRFPEYAPSYRALGLYYMKKNELDKAKINFEKYLRMVNNPQDSVYVQEYLKKIQ